MCPPLLLTCSRWIQVKLFCDWSEVPPEDGNTSLDHYDYLYRYPADLNLDAWRLLLR